MMHDPVAALRDAFGGPPDTSTLKGLLRYLELWFDSDEASPPPDLIAGCRHMIGAVEQARRDTETDLKSNAKLDEGLAGPIRDSLEAYQNLQQTLGVLSQALEGEEPRTAGAHFEALQQARQQLDLAQQNMAQWLERPVLRCPACGATGEDPCPGCGLELVYADAGGDSQQSATLPQEYGPVYQAYQAIMQAEESLSTLDAPLNRLGTHLRSLHAMANSSLREQEKSQALARLLVNLEESLDAVAEMHQALATRQLRDLREGWTRVFQAAIDHTHIRAEVVLEFGGEEEKAALKSLTPPSEDSIVFSGD